MNIVLHGSCDPRTGIDQATNGIAEVLSTSYVVGFCPINTFHGSYIELKGGTILNCVRPHKRGNRKVELEIFVGAITNAERKSAFKPINKNSYKIFYAIFNSEFLPYRWASIISENFDAIYCASDFAKESIKRSGLIYQKTKTFPLPLDLTRLLASSYRRYHRKRRVNVFLISSSHANENRIGENHMEVVDAILDMDLNINLKVHSNALYDTSLVEFIDALNDERIALSKSPLDERRIENLMINSDIFIDCSAGESTSIRIRQALATGKILILSDIGLHRELGKLSGVFLVPPARTIPALYPKADYGFGGAFYECRMPEIKKALVTAIDYLQNKNTESDIVKRKAYAAQFSYVALSKVWIKDIKSKIKPSKKKFLIVPCHDGGLFSLFNVYLSHLVWETYSEQPRVVIPDWRIQSIKKRQRKDGLTGFCYGTQKDGNIWDHLFEPMYPDKMSLDDVMKTGLCDYPFYHFNEVNEPWLTHIHPGKLYNSSYWPAIRKKYANVLHSRIRLKTHLQYRINRLISQMDSELKIAVHVRHASHGVEQIDKKMPSLDSYAEKVDRIISESITKNYTIYLATDTESSLKYFQNRYGDRVHFQPNARRIRDQEDLEYQKIKARKANVLGYQLSNIILKNQSEIGLYLAEEIIIDTWLLASCDFLVHKVSNISTAAGFINPSIKMVYMF